MTETFPIWIIIIDYLVGVVMWMLIGRFAIGIFLPEDSSFFFMRFFVKSTNPIIKVFSPVTPSFLVQALIPVYAAWFIYVIRFYLMPWLLGYSVIGMLSFPLESDITHQISKLVGFLM